MLNILLFQLTTPGCYTESTLKLTERSRTKKNWKTTKERRTFSIRGSLWFVLFLAQTKTEFREVNNRHLRIMKAMYQNHRSNEKQPPKAREKKKKNTESNKTRMNDKIAKKKGNKLIPKPPKIQNDPTQKKVFLPVFWSTRCSSGKINLENNF